MQHKLKIILLIIGVSLVGVVYYIYNFTLDFILDCGCEEFSNSIKNELQKVNRPCMDNNDCQLMLYYPCKIYCIHKDINFSKSSYYADLAERPPECCILYSCADPEIKWECICENNTCTPKRK
jgi:hypothetical protein